MKWISLGGAALLAGLCVASCGRGAAAQNSAVAQAVLTRAADPRFADASTAARAAVRHLPSGMVCALPGNGAFDLGEFPDDAANPGAYCSRSSNQEVTTLMAVQFGANVTLDLAFADALAATAGQASPRHWSGQGSTLDDAPPTGAPHFRIARFEATIDGEPRYLRVAMSEARGWYMQQIVSGPLSRAAEIEGRAGREWRDLLADFAHPPAA